MGFDRDVLLRAGIEEADAFAAVSSGDNSNIISARVARETFGVERVVARIYDAKRAAVYERLGIPTVATVPWTTDRLLQRLTRETETTKWRDPTGNVGVTELALHEDWVGPPDDRPGSRHRRPRRVPDPLRRRACCPTPRPSSRPATRCTSPRSPGTSPKRWPSRRCRPSEDSRDAR